MPRTIRVTAEWDSEVRVWTAFSDDLPGLVSEAATIEALVDRVRAVIPDLLDLADPVVQSNSGVRVVFHAERAEMLG